jgi:hypothetical protein
MNKYNIIEKFFTDQNDYIDFLVKSQQRTIANNDATCFAELTHLDDCFLYKLTWLNDGKFIGDYVKPFKATESNINQFNEGCRILAERLAIYVEIGDASLVPLEPLAFGDLTEIR